MSARIRRIGADEATARIGELAAILVDAVDHGASVNFMAGLRADEAATFWRRHLPAIGVGETQLFVAEADDRLVGTVLLMFAPQPNAPHRAEIGKMLVHSSLRGQGIGGRLLQAAEAAALQAGRTLLMLDTETGSAGDRLYRRHGWTALGEVPGHSYRTDGRIAGATIFYKALAAAP